MALAPIAPWLQGPDVMGAIRAGTSAGMEMTQQDIGGSEAGDRLSLAYNQLASQERRASQAAESKLQLAHSALSLKASQMDMLHEYRMGLIKQKQDELGLRENRGEMLDKYRAERMADQEKSLDLRKQSLLQTGEHQKSMLDLAQQNMDLRQEKSAKDPERDAFVTQGAGKMFEAIRKENPAIPEAQALTLAKDMLKANYDELSLRQKKGAASTKSLPKVTTQEAYDDLETGDMYIGQDGKKYRKP